MRLCLSENCWLEHGECIYLFLEMNISVFFFSAMPLREARVGIWVYLIKSRAGFEFCHYDVSCNKPQASHSHITLFLGWSLFITGFFLLPPSLSELGHPFVPAAQRGFLYTHVPLWVLFLVSQPFLVSWRGQRGSLLSWFSLRPSRVLSPEGGFFRWSWPSPSGWVSLMVYAQCGISSPRGRNYFSSSLL